MDLLFANREGLVGDAAVGGHLLHSDHEMVIVFNFWRRTGVSRTATSDFRRAALGLFRCQVDGVPWETVLKGRGVQEGWTFFKNAILQVQDQATPMCQKTSPQGRRPAWLNRELWLELRKKKRVYDLCKKGQATQEDYKDVMSYAGRKLEEPKPN